ncbi:MAG: helix-turn-helix domain-containing protein [Actinomycetota bacterium]
MKGISEAIGEALRRARRSRGMTLHDVRRISNGRFKPSSVGSYERGTRTISVPLLCELSALYGIPPDRVLADALSLRGSESQVEVVIDLNRLPGLEGEDGRILTEFVGQVRALRGDVGSDVITLRAGDMEILASAIGSDSMELLKRIRPTLKAGSA